MTNFYDRWLAKSAEVARRFEEAPEVMRDAEVPWEETRQDARAKLLISAERGFPTMGSSLIKAEIPVGWHTGKHSHGEEAIHFISGEGFSIVDGRRYDWHAGTTLHVPYRVVHQHFNTGSTPAQYLSAMAFDLEVAVHLARLEQIEDCGPNDPAVLASFPAQESQFGPAYPRSLRRLALHLEDAPVYKDWQHSKNILLMGMVPSNGFQPRSVAMTHIFEEAPYTQSGRHAHLEAMIYVLEGRGHSEVHGQRVDWQAGDALHVPPNMSVHQHQNPYPETSRYLRIQFGIRFWFQEIWPEGYLERERLDGQVAGKIAPPAETAEEPAPAVV